MIGMKMYWGPPIDGNCHMNIYEDRTDGNVSVIAVYCYEDN